MLGKILRHPAWAGASVEIIEAHTFEGGVAHQAPFRGKRKCFCKFPGEVADGCKFPARVGPAYRITHPAGAVAFLRVDLEEESDASGWKPGELYRCAAYCWRGQHYHIYPPGKTAAQDAANHARYEKWSRSVGLR